MLTKEQIDSVLNPRGYTCHSFSGDMTEYYYSKFGTEIGIVVYADKNSFELVHTVENSIFRLICPECIPFYEEESKYNQFDKMYNNFKIVVHKLRR